MGRSLGFLLFGLVAGTVLFLLGQRLHERAQERSPEGLADRISERLEALEREAASA